MDVGEPAGGVLGHRKRLTPLVNRTQGSGVEMTDEMHALSTAEGEPVSVTARGKPDPVEWVDKHARVLRQVLDEHGAVLVHGLDVREPSSLAGIAGRFGPVLRTEPEPFAQRESYGDGVFSASKWPHDQEMCCHHEASHASVFPGLLAIACLRAPAAGGATVLADSVAVRAALPPDLLREFEQRGWSLRRGYPKFAIGMGWQQVFGTDDRENLQRYCRDNAVQLEPTADGGLRTRQQRPAVLRHPRTGRWCWFNQIAFLSEWSLDPAARQVLLAEYGDDGLPFTTDYGDGERLGADVVGAIDSAYRTHTRRVHWAEGALLLVDNLRTAHGREAFSGDRALAVAMADPVRLRDCVSRPAS